MSDLQFFFSGEPVAKAPVRNFMVGKFVRKFTPQKTRDAMGMIRHQAESQLPPGFEPIDGPIKIDATFYRIKPKSTKKRDIFPATRPDLSNYLKLLEDALNQVVWIDDGKIIEIVARKLYSDRPGIRLTVTTI